MRSEMDLFLDAFLWVGTELNTLMPVVNKGHIIHKKCRG